MLTTVHILALASSISDWVKVRSWYSASRQRVRRSTASSCLRSIFNRTPFSCTDIFQHLASPVDLPKAAFGRLTCARSESRIATAICSKPSRRAWMAQSGPSPAVKNQRSVHPPDRFVHHSQSLVDREGIRFLNRWEVPKGLRPLRHYRLRTVQHGDVLQVPLPIGIGRLISAFIGVGTEIEEFRPSEPNERLEPESQRALAALLHEYDLPIVVA